MLSWAKRPWCPLAEFSLEGSARRSLRHSWNRVSKEGCHFEMLSAAQVAALLPELKSVSDDWLTAKSTREKGFSLGAFDPATSRNARWPSFASTGGSLRSPISGRARARRNSPST